MDNPVTEESILSFRLKDTVLGGELSMENMNLTLLSEYTGQVLTFLKGNKRIDLSNVKTALKSGSLIVEVDNETGLLDDAFKDFKSALTDGDLSSVDDTRATVIEEWQQEANKYPERVYELIRGMFQDNNETDTAIIRITSETDYKRPREVWVMVEKYVYGNVYDLGGKSKANVHLSLSNGSSLTISAEAKKLIEDKENRLYQNQLVRITAEENISNKTLRNERLVSFENYNPHFDEDEFDQIVANGTQAWGDITNASRWVEELRGNA